MKDQINSGDNILSNGEMVNRHGNNKITFKPGDAFFIENESYVGRFLVQGLEKDAGTTFVRVVGGAGNGEVILHLSYIRKQYAMGKIKLYDKDGGIIGN